jgi:hypothetical protein
MIKSVSLGIHFFIGIFFDVMNQEGKMCVLNMDDHIWGEKSNSRLESSLQRSILFHLIIRLEFWK